MASSEMLRRVAFVRPDVSEEHIASIIKVTRFSGLGTLALQDLWFFKEVTMNNGVFWDVMPCS
jgi:hypothetical protein